MITRISYRVLLRYRVKFRNLFLSNANGSKKLPLRAIKTIFGENKFQPGVLFLTAGSFLFT